MAEAQITLVDDTVVTLAAGTYCAAEVPELVGANATKICIPRFTKIRIWNGEMETHNLAYQQFNCYVDLYCDTLDLFFGTLPIILIEAIEQQPKAPDCPA